MDTEDDELVRTFEAGAMPKGGFRHPDHVRVAWWYLRRHPLPQALALFSEGLRRFAAARGKPEMYYTPETLWSERARRTFVMPDRLV